MSAECHKHGCDLVYGDGQAGVCQVCEFEVERDSLRAMADGARAERDEAGAEAEELRAALAFYATPANWDADGAIQTPGLHPMVESPVGVDRGHRAAAALGRGLT